MLLKCKNIPLPFLKLEAEVAEKVFEAREMALPWRRKLFSLP